MSISLLKHSTYNKVKHIRLTLHCSIDNHIFYECFCLECNALAVKYTNLCLLIKNNDT